MRTILPPLLRDVLGAFGGPVVRVAVCGAGNCGKTVFVASLLEHLRNHDPARFDLRGWRVVSAEALAPADGFPEFPLAACRAALCGARPDWPAKTGTASLARFRVALRRGASRRSFVLEMLDLPGERLADVAFMSGRGYGGWCDALGRALSGEAAWDAYSAAVSSSRSVDGVLAAWREFLFRAVSSYSPVVSPSSALVAASGETLSPRSSAPEDVREALARMPLGLGPGREFAPLPPEVRSSAPDLGARFAAAYRDWKRAAVEPVAGFLAGADAACWLVDTLELLNGGVAAYNGARRLGEAMFAMFPAVDNSSWLSRRWTWNFRPHVRAFALVATKADRAGPGASQALADLAGEMFARPLAALDLPGGARPAVRAVAAAVAAVPSPERPGFLHGSAVTAGGGTGTGWFPAPDVPSSWPKSSEWKPGSWPAPDLVPRFPERDDEPPPQEGLDSVAALLLGLSGQGA